MLFSNLDFKCLDTHSQALMSRFLILPREIRGLIYSLVLVHGSIAMDGNISKTL